MSLKKRIQKAIPSQVYTHHLKNKDAILFTFDDGPHPQITVETLDVLEQYNAKALFCISTIRLCRAPNLLSEILSRGHRIANHSFSHIDCENLSFSEIADDIKRCQESICNQCGIKTDIFRPPKGRINARCILASKITRHKIVKWSIDSGEYSHSRGHSGANIADRLLSKIKGGDIVLSHDDIASTPEYLRRALPVLVERGFDLQSGLNTL